MIFASLQIERDPPRWSDFTYYLGSWVQVAGGVAAIALVLWTIHYFAEKKHHQRKPLGMTGKVFVVLAALAGLCYLGFFASLALQGLVQLPPSPYEDPATAQPRLVYSRDQQLLLIGGGFFALAAVLVPMIAGLAVRLSLRRVGAIARLSVKEAIRQRIIYAFGIVALIFLFAPYFISYRDEDQLRNYVMLIHTALAPLFLVTAAFLGAFSIPTDVQRQTIHTIVTKPVEKYEIVLGRFFGYGFLLTAVLVVLTGISYIYVVRGVNEKAAQESYKARVPVFSDQLAFIGTANPYRGDNVGREWTYRSYIRGRLPGSNEPRQFAVWVYQNLPADLSTTREPVPFEFSFDIFRTTKGKENQGVLCTLTFLVGSVNPYNQNEIDSRVAAMKQALQKQQKEISDELKRQNLDPKTLSNRLDEENRKLKDKLSEEYGIFQESGTVIYDYHTQSVVVPAGILRKAISDQQRMMAALQGQPAPQQGLPPALFVLVNVNDDAPSAAQFIGVARRDLYLLAAELPFWSNFGKMMIGLWCNTILVLGVAVACSTYLSGVISLLCAMFLLGAGAVVEYIRSLAMGTGGGGGPFESFNRLLYRLPMGAELEQSAATQLGTGADIAFRWVLGYILNLVPDIHRFNLTEYVAEGFNIPWGQVIFLDNIVPLVGYLIPWAVLAYYLISYREIANPT